MVNSTLWPGYQLGFTRITGWEGVFVSDKAGLMLRFVGDDCHNLAGFRPVMAYRIEQPGEQLLPHGPGNCGVEVPLAAVPAEIIESARRALI